MDGAVRELGDISTTIECIAPDKTRKAEFRRSDRHRIESAFH
jgi:hypothetical protein